MNVEVMKLLAGTYNRYRAFISLCYRQGLRNRKVTANPSRDSQSKKESIGRLRYLGHLSPKHKASVVDKIAGARLGDQHAPVHAPAV
jgi:hypothetical protein